MEDKSVKKEESLGETIKTVIYAIVIAGLIRSFLYEPFKIPSGSMYPTLEVGDFLFVSKYTYGYSKYSFPNGMASFNGRYFDTPPERGDIVVFKYPGDNKTDYIKRVIGLPNETVQMIDGRLYINKEIVEREYVDEYIIDEYVLRPKTYKKYTETLPNGRQYNILELSDSVKRIDNTVEFTIPDGHYFMMGDNRDNSNDSRKDVGFVPYENIEGKAQVLFYSHDGTSSWYNPISWLKAIRLDRLFNKLK